ncbi:MAG TPA: DNA-binding protein [Bacteroidetes bacterium]|nr:DNA-binding protein [Bacteroidota bacterium]
MNVELITKQDLEQFKQELLEIIERLTPQTMISEQKWLKSYQVKNLLKISTGTLQHLRASGTISFSKVGGIIYYKYDDIIKALEGRKKASLFDQHPLRK